MSEDISYSINNNFSSNLKLDKPVTVLSQVSDTRKKALEKLGIKNIRQLINYFPNNYIDLSQVSTIADSKIGFNYTIYANVRALEEKEPKPGVKFIEITVVDETGPLIAAAFNQKWLLDSVKPDDRVAIAGKIEENFGFKRIKNPYIYVLNEDNQNEEFAKVLPIYKSNSKISSSWIKRIIANAFEYLGHIDCFIPNDLVTKYKLMDYFEALKLCHSPDSMQSLGQARRTIKYSQVLLQQCFNLQTNVSYSEQFSLITCEFAADKISRASHAIALYKDSGGQAIMMTKSTLELSQYKKYFEKEFNDIHLAFQIIDENTSKQNVWKSIYDFNNGDLDVLIGTSVLLEQEINCDKLKLLVIDEKQNFTKDEISKFLKYGNENVDKLYISNMPLTSHLIKLIYPECANTHFGYKNTFDCQVKVMQKDDSALAYDEALKWTYDGGQVAIICPLVGFNTEERNNLAGVNNDEYKLSTNKYDYNIVSIENLSDNDKDNSDAAIKKYKMFENRIFRECQSALVHSKLNTKEILKALNDFNENKINVIVCSLRFNYLITSKNPLIIIVEDADRIGLSQLHQIRNFAVYKFDHAKIYLLSNSKNKNALHRLNLMTKIVDGASLIENDLKLRQEGSTLGLSNWGFDALKLINVVRDKAIIETANKDALTIMKQEPKLQNPQYKLLSFEISRTFKS